MGGEDVEDDRLDIRFTGGWLVSSALYIVVLAIRLGGIDRALIDAHVASTCVAVACLIIGGVGVMMAVSRTRLKDPPN